MLSVRKAFARSGFGGWPRCRTTVAAMVGLLLLPVEASHAGWLSDVFKGTSKQAQSSKRQAPKQSPSPKRAAAPKPAASKPARVAKPAAAPKRRTAKVVAPKAAAKPSVSKTAATTCEPSKFRIVLDVGHTAQSEGAISARNVSEFVYNLRLTQRIEEKLKAEGFTETKLLLTEGKARASLVKRVAAANNLPANLFLSIHHDSVPKKFLEDWEFGGRKSRFSDRFSGYSVFVSSNNPEYKASLSIAELLAKEMKAQGLKYAEQYSQPIMGRYQHPLLNKETGVYSYDKLIVLKKTRMAAVLLEAGSIINRDEELQMDSAERRGIISSGVVAAIKEYCDRRWGILGPL
ncbi:MULTISPECIES: N-acetylmuramoyl-L-alanine amidase [unclassified Bradyrhizobium]|uniref:N-acetylmuramoyl-L-alanine amidase family protein n=1 Tax=unclassified Bradyrhizobium TaxID=2631580 RepID=UPI002013701C|nr:MULTISPECIES: N-acetylmuramoyl-L-alanine amidase [unclassified Bradyrhizobium]